VANDHQHSPVKYRVAILDSVTLAVACLLTYMLVTDVLSHVSSCPVPTASSAACGP